MENEMYRAIRAISFYTHIAPNGAKENRGGIHFYKHIVPTGLKHGKRNVQGYQGYFVLCTYRP